MDRIQESIEHVLDALDSIPRSAYVTHDQKKLVILLPDECLLVIPGEYRDANNAEIDAIVNEAVKRHTK